MNLANALPFEQLKGFENGYHLLEFMQLCLHIRNQQHKVAVEKIAFMAAPRTTTTCDATAVIPRFFVLTPPSCPVTRN